MSNCITDDQTSRKKGIKTNKMIKKLFLQLGFIPKIFILLSIILLIPLFLLIFYPDEARYLPCFLIPAVGTALVGLLLQLKQSTSRKKTSTQRQHDVIIVIAIWLYAFLIGAIPFVLAGQLNFLHAVFESVSGWTTTGFTVMDVSQTPLIFLFFRSFMHFCGGLGFVLLMLLFASGGEAMKLFSAEGHPDKLEANLISTARLMMYIYLGFMLGGAVLYMVFGMSWFDAVNHSMSAIATGGFTTRVESIGYYQSIPIESVTVLLMLLGSTNFAILALLVKGKLKKLCKIGELRFFFLLMVVSVFAIAAAGVSSVYSSFGESLRVSIFQVVATVTTTGFLIEAHTLPGWMSSMNLIIILLMLIGGGAGSTAGGLKYSRLYILYKAFMVRLRQKFLPGNAVSVVNVYKPQGKTIIPSEAILEMHHFVLIYLATFFVGTLGLTFCGVSLENALFDFASSLGTIGLTSGLTTAGAGNVVLVIQIIGMILARLEVYIIYIFCTAGVIGMYRLLRRLVRKVRGSV